MRLSAAFSMADKALDSAISSIPDLSSNSSIVRMLSIAYISLR